LDSSENSEKKTVKVIRMAYFQHKPHQYLDEKTGKPKGAAIFYFEKIAAKMGCSVEWIGPLPLVRLMKYLEQGKNAPQIFDGVALMIKTTEFESFLYFGDRPSHLSQSVFVVREDSALNKIGSIDDVKGYRLGFHIGSKPPEFVVKNIDMFKVENLAGEERIENSIAKLRKNRIDAIIDLNPWTIPFVAKELNMEHKIKVLDLPEPPQPIFTAFSKNSLKGEILVKKYNEAMKALQIDYNQLLKREFDKLDK